MRFKATIVAAALLAAFATTSGQATMLPYKNLDSLVGESDGIVIGTVRSVESTKGRGASDYYTYVTIDQLDVVSGKLSGDTLTLRLKGGFDGRQGLHVEGAPEFAQNERVMLFVQGNGRDLVPFVGWSQGVFRIADDASGQKVVHDADGHAVVGVERGHVLRKAGETPEAKVVGAPELVRQRSAAPSGSAGTTDTGTAVSEQSVTAAAQAPMSAERFVAEVRQRAGAGRVLSSVTPQDAALQQQNEAAEGRDAPAKGEQNKAPAASAAPPESGIALPVPRKEPAAPQQR